ncbi:MULTISPECIES: CHASE3 domain-containing protein [unclassified Microcoleus]|uniref:CHASE3 domain-containing protein n=1 Tax=unclassified Microcoleus TaxID=2642155 RepID=UPI002FD0029A
MSQNIIRLSKVVPLGFGSIFLLMISIGLATKLSMDNLAAAIELQTHTYVVKTNLQALEKDLLDAETGQRGFIFTGKEEFLEPYKKGRLAFYKTVNDTKELIKDNPEQVKRLEQVENFAQQKLDELAATISLKRAGKEPELRALVISGKGKILMDEIRDKLAEMLTVEDALLVQRTKLAKQSEQLATIVSIGGTVVAVVLGSFIVLFIFDKIIRPINQVANTIASSSTEIAATVEQQERTAAQQSSSVNQTTITMDELGAASQQSAQQAQAGAESARQALKSTEKGTLAVEQTLESMIILKENVGAIAAQILQLSEQTHQIGNISTDVTDLANQTNMLALNASVEAVRAGENAKGFTVIATEIRKLADQSKKSAEKINRLVDDIKNAINSTVTVTKEGTRTVELGTKISQETAAAFSEIANAVNNVVLNNQQISLTAQQQAVAIQQVVDAMNSLNLSAKETASGITQTKVGTQQLNDAAQNLNSIV